jgi:hypothetical protein
MILSFEKFMLFQSGLIDIKELFFLFFFSFFLAFLVFFF